MGTGKPARLWALLLVTISLFATTGCHLLFGDFKEAPGKGAATTTCDKGATRCKDEILLMCSDDQKAWFSTGSCASKDQCDSKTGTCRVCPQADMLRCNGAKREYCSADRTKWMMKELCRSAEECSPAGCGPCQTPGQLQCSVDDATKQVVIRECSPDKTWQVAAQCPSDVVCMATLNSAAKDPINWNRRCEAKCTPGTFQCDGVTLQRCPEGGLDWMAVGPCATKELCEQTLQDIQNNPALGPSIEQCNVGCGAPGQPRCVNGTHLDRCNATQTAWEPVTDCPAGMMCTTVGEGGCSICTPGDYQCNGAILEQCDASHVWVPKADCKTRALCSFSNDADGNGKSTGQCLIEKCARAGDNVCGSEDDPLALGSTLWECNSDLTGFTKGLTCPTTALCNATDKRCDPVVCEAGQRRCNVDNLLEVQVCKPGRDGWESVTTCAEGEYCDPTSVDEPCKKSCPAPVYCNDRTPVTCSPAGVVSGAACLSKELCECAVRGDCAGGIEGGGVAGAMGCGRPVCGGDDMPNFRCTDTSGVAKGGPILQQCKSGRDGWVTAQDCKSANLCYPGDAPYYKAGYCAICPQAGEVMCRDAGTSTCNPDRKGWTVKEPSCGTYGCRDGGTNDYCAVCNSGETRCNGLDPGSELLTCTPDARSLAVKDICKYGCLNDGINDSCASCGKGELRCAGSAPGSKLQQCADGQKSLVDAPGSPCANGCIDNGLNDYCAECKPGESQCSGNGVHVCGADGHWGEVTPCGSGCVENGAADYCGGCAKGELRCAGNTLQQCSDDQKTLVDKAMCEFGCIDDGLSDVCAACSQNERRCMGSDLLQCSLDRKTIGKLMTCDFGCVDSALADFCAACMPGELRCAGSAPGSVLQVCSSDRTMLLDSKKCDNGCFEAGLSDYCGECKPGTSQCTDDGLQVCGDNGRWQEPVACENGCFDDGASDYCRECKSGQTSCDGATLRTCTSAGKWSTTGTSCANGCIDDDANDYCAECRMGDKTCSGKNLLSCTAEGRFGDAVACELGCHGKACDVCKAGDARCGSDGLEQCMDGQWGVGMSCANGCFGTEPSASCGECAMNDTKCADTMSSQVCKDGKWGTATRCPNDVCMGKACVLCTPDTEQCEDATRIKVCNANGAWGAPMDCPDGACVEDACAQCMPSKTQCANETQIQTCNSSGSWGPPSDCPSGACLGEKCVDCQPGDTECVDSANRRVCSANGAWGAATMCPNMACVGKDCAECVPGTKQCMGTSAVQTCDTNGTWITPATTCEYGCLDNGTSDRCLGCPAGVSECVGNGNGNAKSLRTCTAEKWVTTKCDIDCVDNDNKDYCAQCTGTARECTDDSHYHACGTDQRWAAAVACPAATPVCLASNGSCVVCKPGSTQCSMDTQQTCDATGSWGMDETCPNGCMGDVCAPEAAMQ